MAGLCKPPAAKQLVTALKQERSASRSTSTPTTPAGAAAEHPGGHRGRGRRRGRRDGRDERPDQPAQPGLAIAAATARQRPRYRALDKDALLEVSDYWRGVRKYYRPFEPDMRARVRGLRARHAGRAVHQPVRAGDAHGPGGPLAGGRQDLRPVNEMFGNIVKVTPTSKVVGDMALYMVTNGLTNHDARSTRPRRSPSRTRSRSSSAARSASRWAASQARGRRRCWATRSR